MPLCIPVILFEFIGRSRRGSEPVGEPATN